MGCSTCDAPGAGSLTWWIVRKAEPAIGKARPFLAERSVISGRLRFHVKHRGAEKLQGDALWRLGEALRRGEPPSSAWRPRGPPSPAPARGRPTALRRGETE